MVNQMDHATRALFFSSITVTPTTGGGNFVYNLLEPAPDGCEIYYAGPGTYPTHMAPFPELAPRVLAYPDEATPFMSGLPEGRVRDVLRDVKEALRLNSIVVRTNTAKTRDQVLERVSGQVEELRPNVLLACPQSLRDVMVATEVSDRFGLPLVVWFMDDYYKDRFSKARVRELWDRAGRHFVSSDTMRERFLQVYGGDPEVLLNPIRSPEPYSEPRTHPDGLLRVAYAGTVNSYYAGAMKQVLREVRGLGDRLILDIYTFDGLPEDIRDPAWRQRAPVGQEALIPRLKEYDVLLLLSSFERRHREIAETAQGGKLADYLAAGRCILAYGPPYAENVRYIERHDIGETVTSDKPGALRNAVLGLAQDPGRRRSLGEAAYLFGREHRDRAKNRDRLWRALLDAARARAGG